MDKDKSYTSEQLKNISLDVPLKLMLNLVKEHLPRIKRSGNKKFEYERKLWGYAKQRLEAAGYPLTVSQIKEKYRFIEQNYKNFNQLSKTASHENKEMEIGALAENTQKEKELKNNKQTTQSRGNKKAQELDLKYAEIFDLLETWGLSDLKAKFKANYVVVQALEYLTEADIIELIPKIGQRAIFRAKLNQWRQQKSSENINVPEPKKIKLERDIEIRSPPPTPQQPQQIETELSPPQQSTIQQQNNIIHKFYGNLKKVTPTPRPRKINQKKTNIISGQTQNIQSRVQQFIIGSPPQTTTSTTTASATSSGSSVCRLSSPTSVVTANGGRIMTNSSPTLLYNLPPNIECRRFPSMKPSPLTATQIHNSVRNQIHNAALNHTYNPVATQKHTPVSSRIINSDNLTNTNGMSHITQAQGTSPTIVADLTPFATSIIRVETNCEPHYPSPGDPSSGNPIANLKRTTIIQKLTPDKKTTPPQQVVHKPLIMPKPIESLQNPQVVLKSTEILKSPEVPKPKTLLIPKEEPIDDIDEETLSMADCNDFDNIKTNDDISQQQGIEKEPEDYHESREEPEFETVPEVTEPEAETEQEPNPEVEEFTLQDDITEISDLIKEEVLDSDTRSDHEGNDINEENDLSTEMNDSTKSQDNKSVETEPTKADITRLDIRKVLMSSKLGRRVIKRYVSEEILDEPTRRLLVEVVAQYCFDNKIHITPTYCKDIAEEIIEIFPNERLEEYWVRKGRKLRPPIYNKFHCIRRDFFRRKALMDARSTDKKENEQTVPSSGQDNDYDDDDNLIIS